MLATTSCAGTTPDPRNIHFSPPFQITSVDFARLVNVNVVQIYWHFPCIVSDFEWVPVGQKIRGCSRLKSSPIRHIPSADAIFLYLAESFGRQILSLAQQCCLLHQLLTLSRGRKTYQNGEVLTLRSHGFTWNKEFHVILLLWVPGSTKFEWCPETCTKSHSH